MRAISVGITPLRSLPNMSLKEGDEMGVERWGGGSGVGAVGGWVGGGGMMQRGDGRGEGLRRGRKGSQRNEMDAEAEARRTVFRACSVPQPRSAASC